MFPKFGPNFKNFLPFSRNQKRVNFWKLLVQSKAWNLEDFEKIGDSLEFFLKNWPKMVKFSQLFAKIQLENIENFDENGQLSVFQGKIGQFSKLFAKIMRNLEKKKSCFSMIIFQFSKNLTNLSPVHLLEKRKPSPFRKIV